MTRVGWLLIALGALVLVALVIYVVAEVRAASARIDQAITAVLDRPQSDPIDEHARVAMAHLAPDDLDEDLSDRRIAAVIGHWRHQFAGGTPDPYTTSPEECP